MKKIAIPLALLVLVIVIAVALLIGSLDKIVKQQIEVIGSELLGVDVRVGAVSIDLSNGAGQLSDITVANPQGYTATHAFDMKVLRLGINLSSIGQSPMVLDELTVDSPVVNLEVLKNGKNNLQQILDNIETNSPAADQAAAEQAEGEPIRLQIRKLLITGVTFNVSDAALNTPDRSGTLPTITRTNLGGAAGATPGQIGKEVIGSLASAILKQALQQKVSEIIEDKAGKALKGLGGLLKRSGDDSDSP